MSSKEEVLDAQHWKFENYRQRITAKQWRELLLNDDDKIIFNGRVYRLGAKPLGAGVVEVYKELEKESPTGFSGHCPKCDYLMSHYAEIYYCTECKKWHKIVVDDDGHKNIVEMKYLPTIFEGEASDRETKLVHALQACVDVLIKIMNECTYIDQRDLPPNTVEVVQGARIALEIAIKGEN